MSTEIQLSKGYLMHRNQLIGIRKHVLSAQLHARCCDVKNTWSAHLQISKSLNNSLYIIYSNSIVYQLQKKKPQFLRYGLKTSKPNIG